MSRTLQFHTRFSGAALICGYEVRRCKVITH